MKNKLLIIAILFVICFTTIAYSALNTNMFVDGNAVVKVDADIRINDVKVINQANGAYEKYNNKYSKTTTSMFATLPELNSTITYQVTLANKSTDKYKLSNILETTYSNTNVIYKIDGIDVDTIVDANSTVVFNITFTTTLVNQSVDLVLEYEFEKHVELCQYTDGTVWEFSNVGTEEYIVPCSGVYKLEVYGGQGASNNTNTGGRGAYVVGNMSFSSTDVLNIYVGGKGEGITGGYNGGGKGYSVGTSLAGGGATDMRLNGNEYEHRIIVAGGGSGAYWGNRTGCNCGPWPSNGLSIPKSNDVLGIGSDAIYLPMAASYQPGAPCAGATLPCTITYDISEAAGGGGYYGGVRNYAGTSYTDPNMTEANIKNDGGRSGNGYARITLVSIS